MILYKAITIIGVAIERENFYKTGKERVCKHPEAASKYCAKCGKPMWEEVEQYMFDDFSPDASETFRGFDVVSERESKYIYLGWVQEVTIYMESMSAKVPDIDKLETDLRNALTSINLWPDNFGIYTILKDS